MMNKPQFTNPVNPVVGAGQVCLRPKPYPYRSILTICSDLDATPDKHLYMKIMRFLNTDDETAMGRGVGLEIGNSIHFRAKENRFSYESTDDAGRAMVRSLIESGHIDCLHSFGERVYSRADVERAIDELNKHSCFLKVWVDHGGAVTNFGPDIMGGHGDKIGHAAYHADLTIDYGIQYVNRGRATSIVGQDCAARLGGLFTLDHPIASGRTWLKEVAKRKLARVGSQKYSLHGSNDVLRPVTLRDGSKVYDFMRCNPHWAGVGAYADGQHIGDVLTPDIFTRLVEREGSCIIYTHLGRVIDPAIPFDQKAVHAFRGLAEAQQRGEILVTTTYRMLTYCRAMREASFESRESNGVTHIDVETQAQANWLGTLKRCDLSGLTFYVPDVRRTQVSIDGDVVQNLQLNPPDDTGRPSVSLPWSRLEFPAW